jgi:hypothetical protein
VPALPAGVAAEQRLGLKVGDSSFSWPLKQCDANAALEGSSRGRGLARCAVFPCVPREKMKNTKKSGWNTLARHAENIHRNSVSYHTWRNTRCILMTACSLGKDAGWDDPTKIPIEDIIELWREQSSKGRYANSLYWGAGGLLDALATAQNT